MTVGALECAALCGAAPGLRSEIDTAGGAARAPGRGVGAGRGRGLPGQGDRARPPRRRAGRARRRADRRRRPPLEDADQRERQGRGLLVRAAGGRPQRDLRAGSAGGDAAPLVGGVPRGPRPAPARAQPDRVDRGRGRARRRPGDQRRGARATAAWSGCCRWCCSATWSASTSRCWRASTRRPSSRSSGSRPRSASINRLGTKPNLDTTVVRFARDGGAHDQRGRRDDRLVASNAALHRERRPDRAAPHRVRLPHLRPRRAAAPAHPARAARPVRLRPVRRRLREAPAPPIPSCGRPWSGGSRSARSCRRASPPTTG